jgi:hypothetical protein
MLDLIDYVVARGGSPDLLARHVQELIKMGYRPHGAMSVHSFPGNETEGFYQPMVLLQAIDNNRTNE